MLANMPPPPEPKIPETEEERQAAFDLAKKLQWDMMQTIPDGTNIVVVFVAFLRGMTDAIEDCPNTEAQVAMLRKAERALKDCADDIIKGKAVDSLITVLTAVFGANKK